MTDERFSCKACGHTVENPDRNRFTLSISRPAVCPACNAPHVYDFGVQLDEGWVKRQIDELTDLKRLERGEWPEIDAAASGARAAGGRSVGRASGRHGSRRDAEYSGGDDDRAFGTQG